MIKCYFVDIKDISSDLPRSNFVESDLAQLANLILATGGLIRPLIIKQSGAEKYTVIEGHREYYAALTAKEQNSSKVEMVNAFVISEDMQSSAIEQLQLLSKDPNPTGIEQLLPTLLAAISHQIQPLVEQLAEQKQMLAALMIDRVNPPTVRVDPIEQPNPPKSTDTLIIDSVVIVEPVKIVDPEPPKPTKIKSDKTSKVTTIKKVADTEPQKKPKIEKIEPDKAPKVTTTKKVAALPTSIDPIKATITLNLINTLSQDKLAVAMERSRESKAVIKLVPDLIEIRDRQPDQKFETWETIIALKLKGLAAGTVKGIIEKLK